MLCTNQCLVPKCGFWIICYDNHGSCHYFAVLVYLFKGRSLQVAKLAYGGAGGKRHSVVFTGLF